MNRPLIVTLDNNCILAFEKHEEPNATAIVELIAFGKAKKISIKIGMSTAMERPRPGEQPQGFPEQLRRIKALGLEDAELFKTPQTMWFHNGETWFVHKHYEQAYLREIHEILFPKIDFNLADYRRRYCELHNLDTELLTGIDAYRYKEDYFLPYELQILPQELIEQKRQVVELALNRDPQLIQIAERIEGTWINAKNDALGLCAHISWGGDIFVTNDNNFYKTSRQSKLHHIVPGKILRPHDAIQEVLLLTSTTASSK
jgi:hypothetical protein